MKRKYIVAQARGDFIPAKREQPKMSTRVDKIGYYPQNAGKEEA